MRRRPVASLVLLLALVLGMAACTEEPTVSGPRPRAGAAVHAAHNDTSTPFNLVSLPALIEHEYDGRDLRLDQVMARELSFTRHHVTYRGGGLTLSGTLTVPSRSGRFPLLVLAHGWQNPAQYDNATATQEQAWLAARGYAVLQPDYRNYGQSDPQPATPVARPLGYPEDVVNAIVATRRARLPFVDTSRVGVVGRSMGGGVALDAVAARPGLVDALVLHSPVSSLAADNFRRWVQVSAGRTRGAATPALERAVVGAYGTPADRPQVWHEASVRHYLDRVDVPVQLHHGDADEVCPVEWSRATAAALRDARQQVQYFEYPGEKHTFEEGWPLLMRRTTAFFDTHLSR
ncbi:alpha/beta fold hydrolase [Nocardioides sp. WL0053]|uniref:Alpha/beta fold hydrolase n=1 Tax=Nocardioides jiangsuensis TaxID=2866161 RepID=A0ABS7RP87_9ACTN|nr:alpha/beta fold hydrolase [Nocardioides jiangsuensis]MBY9076865.1 alpha/beta fold hydrolase [Nocardioides jiangsuensis]